MRWIKRSVWVVVVLLLALAGAVGVYVQRSLPVLDGQLRLSVLKAPVDIKRDASDVTHVIAQSPLDAMRAIGYVHAQERGWQLEFNRRIMHGELAEILGEAALPVDKLLHPQLRGRVRHDVRDAGETCLIEIGEEAVPVFFLHGVHLGSRSGVVSPS